MMEGLISARKSVFEDNSSDLGTLFGAVNLKSLNKGSEIKNALLFRSLNPPKISKKP
jgi:hypothetical protein